MSRSAMQADQTALDITSNNVANQNTVGYTREVVDVAVERLGDDEWQHRMA